MYIAKRPPGDPEKYTSNTIYQELFRCADSSKDSAYGFIYWISNYCKIFSNDQRGYIYFEPWQSQRAIDNGYDDQVSVILKMINNKRLVCLKARQIGQTTLVLLYFLYEMLFNPVAFILLISKGELEAKELLTKIKNIYEKLPIWMKVDHIDTDSKSDWVLSNGSSVHSLSSRRGDSYSATHCLIDEAALLYRANTSLRQVMLNLEPTIGQNGKLFLISKTDKSRPISTFTSIYESAMDGVSEFVPAFVPYYVVPGRDEDWYQAQVNDSMAIDDTLDVVYESYPETPEQALAPKSSSKRLAFKWLSICYDKMKPLFDVPGAPAIDGLKIYRPPEPNGLYIITADPGEGLSNSDPSSITVMDIETQEEVVSYSGKVEPSVLGHHINEIGKWYNNASVLFELNQHGRALKLWLQDNCDLKLLRGYSKTESTKKIGWDQNSMTKPLMYDILAESLLNGKVKIHNPTTYNELASIESSTLSAPKNQHDDQATTLALAVAGIKLCLAYKFDVEFIRVTY